MPLPPAVLARAALRRLARTNPRAVLIAASTGALSTSCDVVPGDWHVHDLTEALVALTALAAFVLALVVGYRSTHRPRPEDRWGRHVALQLPMLAPERYCACGRCGQLSAPGAWLADWHFDVPGVLPPADAPDAIPIRGLAWVYGPKGWEPVIVYVVGNQHPDAPPPAQPPPPVAKTNGKANGQVGHTIPSR